MSKYDTHIEPRLNDIRKWSKEGSTEKEIAKALGVSYATFNRAKRDYPQLRGILTENKIVADETALGSFYRRVTGYTAKEEIKELVDGKLKTVRVVEKHIPPDVNAGQFWLTNRIPENFKVKQSVTAEVEVTKKLEDFI